MADADNRLERKKILLAAVLFLIVLYLSVGTYVGL